MTVGPAAVEAAIARVEALADPASRAAAREAISAVLDLHGEALRRLCDRLRETLPDADRALRAVTTDELIASVLVLHGVVSPVDRDVPGARLDPSLVPIERLLAKRAAGHERCELCGQTLAADHEHLFEIEHRRLRCSCTACSLLFEGQSSALRRVRRAARRVDGFRMTEAQWSALGIPVGLAFFSYSSSAGAVIAGYPGPAGVAESIVSTAAWQDLARDNVELAEMTPDTSALLIDRLDGQSVHILSIDECFRLAAFVRTRWQGFTGGEGPARAVAEFYRGLRGISS